MEEQTFVYIVWGLVVLWILAISVGVSLGIVYGLALPHTRDNERIANVGFIVGLGTLAGTPLWIWLVNVAGGMIK